MIYFAHLFNLFYSEKQNLPYLPTAHQCVVNLDLCLCREFIMYIYSPVTQPFCGLPINYPQVPDPVQDCTSGGVSTEVSNLQLRKFPILTKCTLKNEDGIIAQVPMII